MVAKRYHTLPRECDHCHDEFMASPYNKNTKQYCGNSCAVSARRDPANSKKHVCQSCSTEFLSWNSQPRKFCSVICANLHRNNKSSWYTVCGHRCQGIYEALFVGWASAQSLRLISHQQTLSWIDEHDKTRRYHPDFWVVDWSCFVEIKSNWTKTYALDKMSRVQSCNADIKVLILADDELAQLGVKIDGHSQYVLRSFMTKHGAVVERQQLEELGVV